MIGAIVFFIIGGVGLIAGGSSNKTNIETTTPNVSFEMNSPNVSGKSTIVCGSCGTPNDIDAIYCKKCGQTFR